MTLEARQAQFEERLNNITKMLRDNRNPSVIAQEISLHYMATAKECMEGYTPSQHLRDHWFRFYMAYKALATKCKKIENSQ